MSLKHVSNTSADNNVQVDERCWLNHMRDAGWLVKNEIPGQSDNQRAGVLLARIKKHDHDRDAKKGQE